MALDLSVKSMGHFVDVGSYSGEEESSSSSDNDSCSSNSMTAMNLSLPKVLHYEDDDDDEVDPDDEDDRKVVMSGDQKLTSQQLQLDIAALNLLCLARLQETAAVLAGRRPLPAHMSSSASSASSSYPLVSSCSSPLNRRTHRCDEQGCDKVSIF